MCIRDRSSIDVTRDTKLGRLYAKGGFWSDSAGRVEQCNAFFLPKDMELVVLANSPFCVPGQSFMDRVTQAIDDNIDNLLVRLTAVVLAPLRALFGR